MIGTMKALISEYTVQPHESWGSFSPRDQRLGVIKIRRVTTDGGDKWGVYDEAGNRLRRDALAWRREHPADALVDPSDFRSVEDESVVPNGRAEINDAFEYEMMPSSRTETWSRNHTFTLAEAFFVCGAESP